MPFLADRWKHSFSLAVIASENELSPLDAFLTQYASLPNFRVTVYVVYRSPQPNFVVYHRYVGGKQATKRRIFPINTLRDLAISNVVTSHVVILDMDLWPTSEVMAIMMMCRVLVRQPPEAAL